MASTRQKIKIAFSGKLFSEFKIRKRGMTKRQSEIPFRQEKYIFSIFVKN